MARDTLRMSSFRVFFFIQAFVLTLASSIPTKNELQAAAESRKVHAFFYLWSVSAHNDTYCMHVNVVRNSLGGILRYGNPEVDGQWQHWNHEVLPHWDQNHPIKYPQVR